jgi:FkbM family methyltransferase
MIGAFHTRLPIEMIQGKQYVSLHEDFVGCAVWGPYEQLSPGSYSVVFDISLSMEIPITKDKEVCCRIDIASNNGRHIIFQKNVTPDELRAGNSKLNVDFAVPTLSSVEYRVFGVGAAKLRVGYFRKANPVTNGNQPDEHSKLFHDHCILRDNYDLVCKHKSVGVVFNSHEGRLSADIGGVALIIESEEDLQLIDEVFLQNDYNVIPPYECIAIDIGMNVGAASLALARSPRIKNVLSYEPFQVPFRRAKSNIAANPHLAGKITPMNIGLSNCDRTLEVLSDEKRTIGVSIRGAAAGKKELIQLRDASRELGNHLALAKADKKGVVLKVDCEGSEFAVFESLHRESLFQSIDAMMIEWHKWWSAEKTQADLIAPLVGAGFFVFDRTHPGNPHAGLLLAVRSARAAHDGYDTKDPR